MQLPTLDLVVFILITFGNVLFGSLLYVPVSVLFFFIGTALLPIILPGLIYISLSPLYFNTEDLLAFRSPFHSNLTIVIGMLVIFLVGFSVMKFFSKKRYF